MTDEELAARIEELESVARYGKPAEAAKAALELAKLKSSELYESFKAEMDIDEGHLSGRPQTPTKNLETSVRTPLSKADKAKSKMNNLHVSLNIDDALSTLGYTKAQIRQFHSNYDNPTRKP